MPNEDNRRRLSGETTTQLSVAELIARREAETQEIPVITDVAPEEITSEPTVRFTPVKSSSGKAKKGQPARELHITELLRREGRGAEASETGGFSVPKLVAAASGGVVLCGTVAFAASNWLSSPDERPLAEVRFDERAQARGAADGKAVVKLPKTQEQQTPGTESTEATEQATPRVAPYTQAQQPGTQTQTPTQAQQPTQNQTPPTSSETSTPAAPPSSSETTTPPSSTTTPPPPPPTSSSTTTEPSKPGNPDPGKPIQVDLGILDPVLNPLGNFDFFAPAS
ncbi:hypothetical protein Lesp02_26080 [Lentzea sp. NBRC 105346]|uniref:hypothetical protein n=1 Tax=Lentzea sp. NBRC 105346 TaxID=3032205 RepID=UPI00255537B3|nr:hypothetical protein [Lentzea sp. NBRC 105346]GLZ30419.1 hypothetical protein Lesp02_26080 [Lentzea sp. NBRC 105346]